MNNRHVASDQETLINKDFNDTLIHDLHFLSKLKGNIDSSTPDVVKDNSE